MKTIDRILTMALLAALAIPGAIRAEAKEESCGQQEGAQAAKAEAAEEKESKESEDQQRAPAQEQARAEAIAERAIQRVDRRPQ